MPHYSTCIPVLANCERCGKTFRIPPSYKNKGPARFCSRKCYLTTKRADADNRQVERFWSKVERSEGCWKWTGPSGTHGYGRFVIAHQKCVFAHRFAWTLQNGPIPDGLFICHRCDTPQCVRPDHLFLGTAADNVHDMLAKGRNGMTGARSERNGRAKLSQEQVRYIREHPEETGVALGEKYGVYSTTITAVRRRRNWKDAP